MRRRTALDLVLCSRSQVRFFTSRTSVFSAAVAPDVNPSWLIGPRHPVPQTGLSDAEVGGDLLNRLP
ncbi:hypothetical protein [Micrococcus sp. KRD096]|uniref:hypothetical protein n=1 Tax=Micrococcus sp. KRD096 TaxID=2729721 RepID=UPI0019D1840C|nr:hypothetical protein [Micrococcus sp. KRD096]